MSRPFRPVRVRLFGCSAAAIVAAGGAAGANAACVPNPPQTNGTTICSDRTDGGLVASASTTVNVVAGATLAGSNGNPALAAVGAPRFAGTAIRLNVAGVVDGNGGAGVLASAPNTNLQLNINVAAGGAIRGSSAIDLRGNGNFAAVSATLDNSGSIRSGAGAAIVTPVSTPAYIASITNRAGGFIGGIDASVNSLTNAGTIDGGGGSAYRSSLSSSVVNSGAILSAGAADTLALPFGFSTLVNSGRIANAGAGVAVSAGRELNLTNQVGATIASSGPTAIRGDNGVALVNRGQITGSVIAGGTSGSRIDTAGGAIRGDVLLGAGDDRVVGTLDAAAARFAEITGRVDGGGGRNTAEFVVASDAMLSTLPAPANFQQLQFTLRDGAAVTFAGNTNSGLTLAGAGSFVNAGAVTTAGPAITSAFSDPRALNFTNNGAITATLAQPGDYAVRLAFASSFDNANAITAIGGNGVDIQRTFGAGPFTNSGTITATGTAVAASGGPFVNTGTIRSTGGIGAQISLGGGIVRTVTSTNSGLIEGATIGAATDAIILVNTGTIRATNGIGVQPGSNSTIDNRAGGVIGGTTAGIGFATSAGSAAYVRNAGTINGDVNFARPSGGAASNGDIYIDEGGTINGNLRLASGLLVTDPGRVVDGRFAGATGLLDPGANGGLRLRVATDRSLALDGFGAFPNIGFDLANDAALTLTASRPLSSGLQFAGQGSVDLTADIAVVDRALISFNASTVADLLSGVPFPTSAVSVVSRGALSFSSTRGSSGFPAVLLTSTATFENAGTLTVTARAGDQPGVTGIVGSYLAAGTAINSGTITLAGAATGISGVGEVVNSGRIVRAGGGGGASMGVVSYTSLRNSGTIETNGVAVSSGFYNYSSVVVNSGRIVSTGDAAIANERDFSTHLIDNQAGGTIAGGNGVAIRSGGTTTLVNAGRIVGDVRLDGSQFAPASGGTYVAAGGTIEGNLVFGGGDDVLVARGANTGVSGTIDAGGGTDRFVRSFDASTTVTLGAALPATFEDEAIEARGRDTVVTLAALPGGIGRPLALYGNGSIVSAVDVAAGGEDAPNLVTLAAAFDPADAGGLAFTNRARIADGVTGIVRSFANSGAIGDAAAPGAVVELQAQPGQAFAFDNAGSIRALGNSGFPIEDYPFFYDVPAVILYDNDINIDTADAPRPASAIANSGTIAGGLSGYFAAPIGVTNSGTIGRDAEISATLQLVSRSSVVDAMTRLSVAVANSGTVSASGRGGTALSTIAYLPDEGTPAPPATIDIVNDGTLSATAGGEGLPGASSGFGYVPSTAVTMITSGAATLTNRAIGAISGSDRGGIAVAVIGTGGAFTLDNAGTITGGPSFTVREPFDVVLGSFFVLPGGTFGGAVHVAGAATTLRNSGTITGSIMLGDLADRIENSGRIVGDVRLGGGDDNFVQRAAAGLTGRVDGGDGADALIVDSTGGGAVTGDPFVNFESLTQIGDGNVSYSGNFNYDTIRLDGGSITVAAGATLRTNGAVTITGGAGSQTVSNFGTIAGGIALGAGSDYYGEGAGSTAGAVDGGAGDDVYAVALSGDRSGIGARTGFERLAVTGNGTLTLGLDQSFDAIGLVGTGLDLRLAGFSVGAIEGSDAAERVALDGDVGRVALGAGADTLRLAGATAAGSYDGGGGPDNLAFAAAGAVTLAGSATGFETVTLASGALTVTGTLGGAVGFGDGAQALAIGGGGRLLGSVDLGGGADSFRLAAGGQLLGSVSGGAGNDAAALDLAADLAITADMLRDFETLTVSGGRTLTFAAGSSRFDRIDVAGGLTVAAGATLAAMPIQFGGGNDRFIVAGAFNGSADGGAGNDALELSGGSAAAPIAFQTVAGFESMAVSSGVTTIAGVAQLGRIDMTGGRLIGLAGSIITAPQIAVGAAATFGSAGSVTGNLAVAGTLSPGASPGTMNVTGNVALAAGSTTLLEITPTVSDRLNVSGTLTIAGGATLTLAGERPLTPGAALDLIVAGGGITGSFATVNQAATVLGFLRQSSDRIQLFGQFAAAGFGPQVTATINYVNAVLTGGQASPALIAAVPSLLTTGNATNGAAFARLNPEAYASATQIGIQNGLTLAKAARSGVAAGGEAAGAFTFAQALGDRRPIDGDAGQGTSRARTSSYGLLGGIGFGTGAMSIGGFAGYLDSRQRIPGLDARTDADGVIAGLIGHLAAGGFDLTALLAYDGSKADTRRATLGGNRAAAGYRLRGWISDTSLGYALPLGTGWTLKPEAGLTYVATRRGGATESGGGAFLLDVARRRSHATFVDGALTLSGGTAEGATVRPWVSVGARHQLNGRRTLATAGFVGTSSSFSVLGVDRQATLVTAGAGVAVALTPALDLFGAYRGEFGSDGTGANLNGGLRLRF